MNETTTKQEHREIIIDGKHAIMGRLASYSAKQALFGKKVVILNAGEVIILGSKKDIVAKYIQRIKKGGSSMKGPKIVRTPEKILKRTIRGMLPHKQGRGREALKRVRCYNKVPKEYENTKKIIGGKEKHSKFITLNELVNLIK
jgi:large subunit ribosomal protein L13